MKVCISSAGRRVSLLQNFQRAAEGPVYAVDLDPSRSAACWAADGRAPVPRASDPSYVDVLLELCGKWGIDVLVPTIDTELEVLAQARDRFAAQGTRVAVSSPEVCRTFRLKRTTAAFFRKHGVPTPTIVDDLEGATFPLFAKLDDSSRSVGAGRVDTLEAALALRARDDRYVFQELVTGDEYTVDAFVDSHGQVLGVVPRRRLEVRDGEVSKGIALKHEGIIAAVRELCGRIDGAYGTLTIQVFVRPDGTLSFIEINPRFGGGYPLTMHAGADFASWLLRDAAGERLSYDESWRHGTLMLRYDAEIIVHDRGV
jgi:carbamoyl-phosphate synthase large subunit